MQETELKAKALKGSIWSLAEKFSLQIVQFIVGIVLARLLDPNTFGLIAITGIFLTISGAITDGGFEKALIQRGELSELQISTSFYLNVGIGCAMALLICIAAPLIANFFKEPLLSEVLMVLSISLPLDALGQTQRTLLFKELRFKRISIAQIVSSIASGIVGIIMAYFGWGIWALVYSTLVGIFVRVVFFWVKSDWYPKALFSYSSIRSLIPLGLNVLASSILFFSIQQFNNFIIGRNYTKTDLGLFSRGGKFPEIITGIIQSVILKMSFPLFSKLQNDEKQLKLVLRKTIRIVAFITFPLLTYLFIFSKEITILLLTEKWLGAVIYLKVFCLIKVLDPIISVNRELLLAKGKARLLLRLFIVTSLVEIVPVLLLFRYGIIYVLLISLISKIFQYVMYQIVLAKFIQIKFLEMLMWLVPHAIIVLFTAFLASILSSLTPDIIKVNLFVFLVANSILYVTLYVLLGTCLKVEELTTLKQLAGLINRKKVIRLRGA